MMYRGAIIGLGNIAVRGHVPAFQLDAIRPKLEITAVVDVVPANREKAAELFPGSRFYADVPSLLAAEKLDFVDICSPPDTHASAIAAAAAKGLHIICEKPLAPKYEAAAEIGRLLAKSDTVFVPCHQYKYSPLWSTINGIIRKGELGTVTLAQFGVYRLQADPGSAAYKPAWRTSREQSGGGILADTGAHYFYLAQFFFGMPKAVSAILRTLKHADYGVEDTAVVTLEYPATLMQINLTWAAGQRANSVFIAGTGGSLSYDGQRLLQTDKSGTREIPMPDVSDKSQYIRWYADLFTEFHRRVESHNTAKDLLTEAVNVMKLLDISNRASSGNAVLEVK
jgi:predicted dehydrogenase